MKGYTATLANGETIHYTDRKRWLWTLPAMFILLPLISIGLHAATGNTAWLFLTLLISYVVAPTIDAILGEDRNNPPEELVMQLDRDLYYRRLTYAAVPLHFITLFGSAWYAGTQELSSFAFFGLAMVTGMVAGLAINSAHELGHKNSKLEKNLAKIVLAVPAYGHFCIEHNRGHHMRVSTPEDCSSARMGENIYQFALRDVPGSFVHAWQIEKERLNKRNKPVWHFDNRILQTHSLSLAIAILLVIAFGVEMIAFLLIHHVFAYWQLTSANYVQHYGLLRQKGANGKYERCQPHHSWNSNHTFSNLVLFHLERHSDHHAHPSRRYQSLRHFEDLPQLPNGYFGVYLLAYVPWLWFKIMDKRLLRLPHVQGDLDRVNIRPQARAAIFLQYARDKKVEPRIGASKIP